VVRIQDALIALGESVVDEMMGSGVVSIRYVPKRKMWISSIITDPDTIHSPYTTGLLKGEEE